MPLMLRLALRNLFRNTRRTVLTCLMVGLSLTALVFTDALIKGMSDIMVSTITQTLAGEGQVHRRDFLTSYDEALYMPDVSHITEQLDNDSSVQAYSVRTLFGAMMSSTNNNSGSLIYGINPQTELKLSKIKSAITQGEYLSFDINQAANQVLLGVALAEKLEVGLGERIVLSHSQIEGGELIQSLFRVRGLVKFGMRELDENIAFISLAKSQSLLNIGDGAHEVSFNLVAAPLLVSPQAPIFTTLTDDKNEALAWMKFNPQLGAMMEMIDYSTVSVGAILFLLAALGIINSLYMSIYERLYEIGVVKAIGTQPRELFQLIVLEAALIAVFSIILGLTLAALCLLYFADSGIYMGEFEVEGVSLRDHIPLIASVGQFTVFPFYVAVITLLASLYPARYASRVVPSEALQRTL